MNLRLTFLRNSRPTKYTKFNMLPFNDYMYSDKINNNKKIKIVGGGDIVQH